MTTSDPSSNGPTRPFDRSASEHSPFDRSPFDHSAFDHRAAARDSLRGLATGDAFGAQFFVPANLPALRERRLPPAPWPWTDDTEMAGSVFAALRDRGTVNSYELAHSFAEHHDFDRGYGASTNRMLRLVRGRGDFRKLAAEAFDGKGSWGNGAAMRVAPLGAWFAVDPAEAAWQAARSAEVTHTHPEAVAGAIAVAVAAGWAARSRGERAGGEGADGERAADGERPSDADLFAADLFASVLASTPPSKVREGIAEARALLGQEASLVAQVLGNGRHVSAVDTVPFALWCAATHLADYRQALWTTAGQGGDVDTTCAIVGGIVAAHVGTEGIPADWRAATEELPQWMAADRLGADLGPADFPRHRPMERPEPIPVTGQEWTAGQWQRIRHGVSSRAMEERWEAHLTTDGTQLEIFRNSVDTPWYAVELTRTAGGARPTRAWVDGPHRHRRGGDEVETAYLEFLLDLLFGHDHRADLWERYERFITPS
ncbi:ADP-ribosylglycohydrolase family protein [Kitasatospora sp. NBC_01287]|uniref:ADP-ribosylglycohydrolase family protein n=1 Tax=Kitasatospora sp. NBC_01287 TaxID=2903573 RepID=UPI002B1DF1B3|nr:ADP-ribosylglycohydrolase family protein [Kitasatospora sp. NBC_01287]